MSRAHPGRTRRAVVRQGSHSGRYALEGIALAKYQAGRLILSELRRLLDPSRDNRDGFLQVQGVFEEYPQAAIEQERQRLERLTACGEARQSTSTAFRRASQSCNGTH
jgi:hypothetical protein